jgi:hypothetical protein
MHAADLAKIIVRDNCSAGLHVDETGVFHLTDDGLIFRLAQDDEVGCWLGIRVTF